MGLRYRKSIKIAKGLKLNISSSGISFTASTKGGSLNVGPKGTYATVSIPKTGLSYRKKLGGGYNSLFNNKPTAKSSIPLSSRLGSEGEKLRKQGQIDIDNYEKMMDIILNLHTNVDNVVDEKTFIDYYNSLTNQQEKELLEKAINGDEETISALLEQFYSSLNLPYDIDIDFDVEDDSLIIDLGLFDQTDIPDKYPTLMKSGEVLFRSKAITTLKQQYSQAVISLAIYLAANSFNLTSYLNNIIISAYTKSRNNLGDLVNMYIYSIKFTRDVFVSTDLNSIAKPYDFILKFGNRINLSTAFTFKEITPYKLLNQPEELTSEEVIKDTVAALKSLGYSNSEITSVLSQFKDQPFSSADEFVKAALKQLAKS